MGDGKVEGRGSQTRRCGRNGTSHMFQMPLFLRSKIAVNDGEWFTWLDSDTVHAIKVIARKQAFGRDFGQGQGGRGGVGMEEVSPPPSSASMPLISPSPQRWRPGGGWLVVVVVVGRLQRQWHPRWMRGLGGMGGAQGTRQEGDESSSASRRGGRKAILGLGPWLTLILPGTSPPRSRPISNRLSLQSSHCFISRAILHEHVQRVPKQSEASQPEVRGGPRRA